MIEQGLTNDENYQNYLESRSFDRIKQLPKYCVKRFWVYKATRILNPNQRPEISSETNTTFIWGIVPVLNLAQPQDEIEKNVWDFAFLNKNSEIADKFSNDDLGYTETHLAHTYSLEIDYKDNTFDWERNIYILKEYDPNLNEVIERDTNIPTNILKTQNASYFNNNDYNQYNTLFIMGCNSVENIRQDTNQFIYANVEAKSIYYIGLGENSRLLLQTIPDNQNAIPKNITNININLHQEPILLSSIRIDGLQNNYLTQNIKANVPNSFPIKVNVPLIEHKKAQINLDIGNPTIFQKYRESGWKSFDLKPTQAIQNTTLQDPFDPNAWFLFTTKDYTRNNFNPKGDIHLALNSIFGTPATLSGITINFNDKIMTSLPNDEYELIIYSGTNPTNNLPQELKININNHDTTKIVMKLYIKNWENDTYRWSIWDFNIKFNDNLLTSYEITELDNYIPNESLRILFTNILTFCLTININFYGSDNISFNNTTGQGTTLDKSNKSISSYLKEQLIDKDKEGIAKWMLNYWTRGISLIRNRKRFRDISNTTYATHPDQDIETFIGDVPTQQEITNTQGIIAMMSHLFYIPFCYDNGGTNIEYHKVNAPYYLDLNLEPTLNNTTLLWEPTKNATHKIELRLLSTYFDVATKNNELTFNRKSNSSYWMNAFRGGVSHDTLFNHANVYISNSKLDNVASGITFSRGDRPQDWGTFIANSNVAKPPRDYYDERRNAAQNKSIITNINDIINHKYFFFGAWDNDETQQHIYSPMTDLGPWAWYKNNASRTIGTIAASLAGAGLALLTFGASSLFGIAAKIASIKYMNMIEIPFREQIINEYNRITQTGGSITSFTYSFRTFYNSNMKFGATGGLLSIGTPYIDEIEININYSYTNPQTLAKLYDTLTLKAEPTFINANLGFYQLYPIGTSLEVQKHEALLGKKDITNLEKYFVWLPQTSSNNFIDIIYKLINNVGYSINNNELKDLFTDNTKYELELDNNTNDIRRISLRHLFSGRAYLEINYIDQDNIERKLTIANHPQNNYIQYNDLVLGSVGDDTNCETNIRI